MRRYPQLIFQTLILSSIVACSYQPEDPGQCKLTCSSAIIGGSDATGDQAIFQFELKTVPPAYTCAAGSVGQAIQGARAGFVLYENLFAQDGTSIISKRPVPNISIEPMVNGAMADIDNGETNPAYRGIRTPRSNWCTDACGVATMEIVPVCPPQGMTSENTLQLHSGSLFSESAKFPVSTEEPDTAGLK